MNITLCLLSLFTLTLISPAGHATPRNMGPIIIYSEKFQREFEGHAGFALPDTINLDSDETGLPTEAIVPEAKITRTKTSDKAPEVNWTVDKMPYATP